MAMVHKDGGGGGEQPSSPDKLTFEVTPDNVVEYGVVFQAEADRFTRLVVDANQKLRAVPWLGDQAHPEPVAIWAAERFNEKFDVYVQRMTELRDQYQNMADAMNRSAAEYSKTDELNKALLDRQHPNP